MRRSRPVLLSVVVPLTTLLLTSCTSDGGSDPDDARTSASASGSSVGAGGTAAERPEPVDAIAAANRACAGVLDARDTATHLAARDAGVEVLRVVTGEAEPDADEVSTWEEQLRAGAAAVTADRTALAADLEPLADELDGGLGSLLDDLEETAVVLEARADLLANGGLAGATMADVRAGAAYGTTDLPDWAFGRDCETVNGATSGAPEEGRTFHVAAAGVCADVVDRRRVEDLRSAEEISLNVLADTLSGQELEIDASTTDALATLEAEWRRTLADLESVPTDDVPDADAWDTLLGALEDRADAQATRLAAVERGDADEIGDVYADTRPEVVGLPWVALGLDQRDCRSITW